MLEKVDDGSMGFTPAVQLSYQNKKEQKWSLDACTGYAKRHGLFQCNEMVCTHTLYHEAWAGNLPIGIMELPEAVKRSTGLIFGDRKHSKAPVVGLSPKGNI